MYKAKISVAIGAMSFITGASAVMAQTGEGTLEEIVVTAQKRTESVQDVPISITVLTSEELDRQGVQTIQDLSKLSSSLEFTAPVLSVGGGGFVRGIGTSQAGATAPSSVGVVLDGVVLGPISVDDVFDLNRVEVLKGPQGTLFGSSVSAGVLSLTTNAPDPKSKSATVSAEYGIKDIGAEYSRRMLRAMVNLPLTDTSALRIAAHSYNNTGLFKNTYTGGDSEDGSSGVRVRYLNNLTDGLTLNLTGDYNYSRSPDSPIIVYSTAPAGSVLASALATCGVTASADNHDSCGSARTYRDSLNRGASAQFDLTTFGDNTLTSITSYRKSDFTSFGDIFMIPPDIMQANFQNCDFVACSPVKLLTPGHDGDPQVTNRKLFTQEIRLTSSSNKSLEWVTGLYYQNSKYHNALPSLLIVHPAALGVDITVNNSTAKSDAKTSDYAAFGNVTYYLAPATRLIGGIRYTHSKVSEDRSDPSTGSATVYSASTTASELTWRAGIQQDLGDKSMAYLTVATGYKAPQIDDNLGIDRDSATAGTQRSLVAIKPETPISYELGIKTALLDNRLAVNADVFYTEVQDFQTQACVADPSKGIVCSAVNVPKVVTKGVEFDVFGKPLNNTSVNLTGIYNVAKYPPGYLGADVTNLGGQQLNYAPKYKVTASAEQTIPMGDVYSFVIGADATARGKQSMYLSSKPIYVAPSTVLYNARLGIKSESNWGLYLFGRNLSDKSYPTLYYPTVAFFNGGIWSAFDANSRRMVGLQLDASF